MSLTISVRSLLFVAALGLVAGAPALAADRYLFDKVHTQILFFVSHVGFSMSQGELHDYDGAFTFDPADWSSAAVEVTVRTASVDMDDYEWDKHLRSKDFFNVNAYPEMRFVSDRLEKTGDKTGRLHGRLTLLGETHPLVLDVTFNKAGRHPKTKQYVAGFSARGVVRRSEYGMGYGLPMVGDEVHLRLEVEGIRQGP